jgi:integrase
VADQDDDDAKHVAVIDELIKAEKDGAKKAALRAARASFEEAGLDEAPKIGRRRDLGLGSYPEVGLADAREKAEQARKLIRVQNVDPIEQKEADRVAAVKKTRTEDARRKNTLRQLATDYCADNIAPGNTKEHATEWLSSITRHVPEEMLDCPLARIDEQELEAAMLALKRKHPETASRVGARLKNVFGVATKKRLIAHNFMPDIAEGLVRKKKDREKHQENFAALPYESVRDFVARLHDEQDTGALMLEFAILTAARPTEARGAKWSEIDFTKKLWTLPKARMKTRKPHVVPLSPRALEVLEAAKALGGNPYVFPSPHSKERQCSDEILRLVVKRLGYADRTTVHGLCRATFKTWGSETSAAPYEVIEYCLHHLPSKDKTVAAYDRAEHREARRAVLQKWADYIQPVKTAKAAKAKVIPLRA